MKVETNQKGKLKVILDTNALLLPIQFKIDILPELKKLLNRNFEIVLLSPVKRELETLAENGSLKTRKNAKFALEMTEKCIQFVTDCPQNIPVDDVIIQSAIKLSCPVFTNDKQLRKRLRDISLPVIYLRQKSHLEIDGMI